VTRSPLSRSKGQGYQAALLTAVLARQAAAAVGVGTYVLAVRKCCYVAAARPREARRPRGGEGRGISWRSPAYSLLL